MPNRKVPETSLEAWRSITQEQLNAHHAQILSALEKLQRASSEQISDHTKLDRFQVARRMKDLELKLLVYKTGAVVATSKGRKSSVYAMCKPGITPQKETERVMPGKTISDYSKGFFQPNLF